MRVLSNLRRGVIAACILTMGALQACSHAAPPEEGWVPFTQDELLEYLAGKTQVWDPNGGAYYAEGGKLDTLWDGVRETGRWSVTENGALCWHVSSWGTIECEEYFHVGSQVMYRYYGETGAVSERQEGNTLDILQAKDVVLDIDRAELPRCYHARCLQDRHYARSHPSPGFGRSCVEVRHFDLRGREADV